MEKKEQDRKRVNELRIKLRRIGSNEWTQNDTTPTVSATTLPPTSSTLHTPSTPPTPSTPSLEPPPAKKPRRTAGVPSPHHRPMTPASKSPSVERSPYNGIGLHINSPSSAFPLDGILTPTSMSPCEDIPPQPVDQLISTIVDWDATKIIDATYKNAPFHTNVVTVPQIAFETADYYQKCVPI